MSSVALVFGLFPFDKVLNFLISHPQSWLKKAERIDSLVPLPEGPRTPLLTAMLAVEPYEAPERKEKKKEKKREAREGLRSRGPLDTRSGDTHAPSAQEEEKEEGEEGEESDSSRTKKRAVSEDAEEEPLRPSPKRPCRAKVALSDNCSASAEDSEAFKEVPRRTPRVKPLA